MRGLALYRGCPRAAPRMAYYGSSEQGALLAALRRVHEMRDSVLCPGDALALARGRIRGAALPRGLDDDADYYKRLAGGARTGFTVGVSKSAGTGGPAPSLPAHLPFGFRTAGAPSPHHVVLPCVRPAPPCGGGALSERPPSMRPARSSVPRSDLDQCGADAFAARVLELMRQDENNTCIEALNRISYCDEVYDTRGGQSLGGLHGFVHGMNRRRRPSPGLDTVFANRKMFTALAEGDPSPPAPSAANMLDFGGMRVLADDTIPEDLMVVMSHAHGPLFVDGPVALTCCGGTVVIGRYCQAVRPLGDHPEAVPNGFRVDVHVP